MGKATSQLEFDFQCPQENGNSTADELNDYIRAVEANGRQNRERIAKGAPAGRRNLPAGALARVWKEKTR